DPYSSSPDATSAAKEVVQVGMHDNYFEPSTVNIPAGTTVKWINYGRHAHTATSDTGLWDSRKLTANDVYSFTFSKPEPYRYHCAHHPKEMRGVVVVEPSAAPRSPD